MFDKELINKHLFLFLFTYRLFNSFMLRTIFEPDEVWQCLEPLHYIMFNKGTMTWDWMTGIRSFNFVLVYYIPQYILYNLSKESYYLYCHYGYKTTNALVASLCDYYTIKIYGILHKNTNPIIFLTLFSHALWLYSPRSHINSFEMLFLVLVIYTYTKSNRSKNIAVEKRYFRLSIVFSTFIVYLRPTALIFVSFLYLKKIKKVFNNLLLILVPLLVLIGVDTYVYNEFILPPMNFFIYNIYYGVSSLFGNHQFYLHILFMFVLTGILLPLSVKHSLDNLNLQKRKDDTKLSNIIQYINRNTYKYISTCCWLYFVFYSIQKHKEMRFLMPLVPFVNILCAKKLDNKIRLMVLIPFLFSIYIGYTHQRFDHVITYVRNETSKKPVNAFFCVCPYSLPGYSYLCKSDLELTFLTQNPDINSLVQPYIYKRFGNGFEVKEYDRFITSNYKKYDFNKHDIIVIYDTLYDKFKKPYLKDFVIVKKCKYADLVFEDEKSKVMYILKRY